MKNILVTAVLIGAVSFLSGCTSIMMFQSAKTVPQGNLETGVGLAAGSESQRHMLANFDLSYPSVAGNAWLRYGLTPNWDAGANLSIPGSLTVDTKVMLLNEDKGAPLTFSLGAGGTFSAITDNDSSVDKKQDYNDVFVPLYVSKDVADWLTLYISPRYIYRHTYNEMTRGGVTSSENIYDDMWGLGGGLRFNVTDKTGILLECQHMAPFKDPSFSSTQCGAGLATRWGFGRD